MAQQRTWTVTGVLTSGKAGRLGLAFVEIAIAYEWIISALNKMLDAGFGGGLAHQLQQTLKDNPNRWYSTLINTIVLPHATIYATLIEIGEFLIGLGFVVGAALWLSRRFARSAWARPLTWAVMVAVAAGGLLTTNYYLNGGDTLPGLNPGNPYNEGLSIDGVLTLIALGLLVAHGLTLRRPAAHSAAAKPMRHEDEVGLQEARREPQRPAPWTGRQYSSRQTE